MSQTREELSLELKQHIVEYLNLLDIKPEEINDDTPLFGPDLGLDSIDALEIIVMLEREYGLKIESKEAGQKIFYSLKTMAEFVAEKTV